MIPEQGQNERDIVGLIWMGIYIHASHHCIVGRRGLRFEISLTATH